MVQQGTWEGRCDFEVKWDAEGGWRLAFSAPSSAVPTADAQQEPAYWRPAPWGRQDLGSKGRWVSR